MALSQELTASLFFKPGRRVERKAHTINQTNIARRLARPDPARRNNDLRHIDQAAGATVRGVTLSVQPALSVCPVPLLCT